MTILVVALLGAGILFVASAMDNTPIVSTFQKIIKGEKIDWTGSSSTSTSTTTPTGQQIQLPDASGNCPAGMTLVKDLTGAGVCISGSQPPATSPIVPGSTAPPWVWKDKNGNCPSGYTPTIGNLCHLN